MDRISKPPPRPCGRGPIEAPLASAARARSCAPLHGHAAVAPLKPVHRDGDT